MIRRATESRTEVSLLDHKTSMLGTWMSLNRRSSTITFPFVEPWSYVRTVTPFGKPFSLYPTLSIEKEASHVEGFSSELALVTIGRGKELEEKLVVCISVSWSHERYHSQSHVHPVDS